MENKNRYPLVELLSDKQWFAFLPVNGPNAVYNTSDIPKRQSCLLAAAATLSFGFQVRRSFLKIFPPSNTNQKSLAAVIQFRSWFFKNMTALPSLIPQNLQTKSSENTGFCPSRERDGLPACLPACRPVSLPTKQNVQFKNKFLIWSHFKALASFQSRKWTD